MWVLLESSDGWTVTHEKNVLAATPQLNQDDIVKYYYRGQEFVGKIIMIDEDHENVKAKLAELKKGAKPVSKKPLPLEGELPAKRLKKQVKLYGTAGTTDKAKKSKPGVPMTEETKAKLRVLDLNRKEAKKRTDAILLAKTKAVQDNGDSPDPEWKESDDGDIGEDEEGHEDSDCSTASQDSMVRDLLAKRVASKSERTQLLKNLSTSAEKSAVKIALSDPNEELKQHIQLLEMKLQLAYDVIDGKSQETETGSSQKQLFDFKDAGASNNIDSEKGSGKTQALRKQLFDYKDAGESNDPDSEKGSGKTQGLRKQLFDFKDAGESNDPDSEKGSGKTQALRKQLFDFKDAGESNDPDSENGSSKRQTLFKQHHALKQDGRGSDDIDQSQSESKNTEEHGFNDSGDSKIIIDDVFGVVDLADTRTTSDLSSPQSKSNDHVKQQEKQEDTTAGGDEVIIDFDKHLSYQLYGQRKDTVNVFKNKELWVKGNILSIAMANARNTVQLARRLMTGIFIPSQVANCTLSGQKWRAGKDRAEEVQNPLHLGALKLLAEFCNNVARQKKWSKVPFTSLKPQLSVRLNEIKKDVKEGKIAD